MEQLWAVSGFRRCPRWLCREDVLRNWGHSRKEQRAAYSAFVEQGLLGELWDPAAAAAAQYLIGSDSFVDRMRQGRTHLSEKKINVRRDSTQQRALNAWCSLERLVKLVTTEYDTTPKEVLHRHSHNNEARQVLLYLAANYCRGRYSMTELGDRLGPITVSGLGSARELMKGRLRKSRSLQERVRVLEEKILQSKSEDWPHPSLKPLRRPGLSKESSA